MPEDSSVEILKKKLYRRGEKPHLKARRDLHEVEHEEVRNNWEEDEEPGEDVEDVEEVELTEEEQTAEKLKNLYEGNLSNEHGDELEEPGILDDEHFKRNYKQVKKEIKKEKKMAPRIIKLVFFVSLAFFIFALALAGYFLLGGANQVSCDNVKITTVAPRSIASGKKLSMDISVENRNPVQMRNVELEVIFPEGTKDADYSNVNLSSSKQQIGVIDVNEQVRSPVRALLFGSEMSEHEIQSIVTFNIEGSDAEISCASTYNIAIATAPVNLTVKGIEEISSGQEVELEIVVTSNSEETVPDMRLAMDYPFGFEFVSSEPESANEENTVWEIGNVNPQTERVLKVKGIVRGQGTESRNIGISVGEKDMTNSNEIAIVLQKVEHSLLVTEPFLSLDLELNESSAPVIKTVFGETIKGKLLWENTTEHALHDVSIEAIFDGVLVDPQTVVTDLGYYRSLDNTIIWTPQTTNEYLRLVEPGEKGSLAFSFRTYPFDNRTSITNPSINLECNVQARRISDDISVPQSLIEQAKRKIVFDSSLEFDAYAVYGVGDFTNTGPYPPKINKETTYTIVWKVYNSVNDVSNVLMKGELPVNAEWLHSASPSTESVTFNTVTREVTWVVGDIPRGTGYNTQPREVQFQISVVPSISDYSGRMHLVTDLEIQGIDNFTERMLKQEQRLINSDLVNDPYFSSVSGRVE